MRSFYVLRNKDAADEYISALLSAGYVETRKMNSADFLLMESEHGGSKCEALAEFMKTRPAFMYPHTPYSYWLWDGVREPLPVSCNFVVGNGAVVGMAAYGYPYRVEAVGWTGCEIKPFTPTTRTRLLFAPPHLYNNGVYPEENDRIMQTIENATNLIVDNISRFESVTVNYSPHGLKASGLEVFKGLDVKFNCKDMYAMKNNRQNVVDEIRDIDIVISSNTYAYVAIASGKPTIMLSPLWGESRLKNYSKYKKHYEYPITISSMTIQDVFDVARFQCSAVESWKRDNIGDRFDADKFISIIREYA